MLTCVCKSPPPLPPPPSQEFLTDVFLTVSCQILGEFTTTAAQQSRTEIKLLLGMMDEPFLASDVAKELKSAAALLGRQGQR